MRLVENVVPHRKKDVEHFANELQCNTVMVDADIFGRVSRPRLWWSDIDWDAAANILPDHRWTAHFGVPKLEAVMDVTEVTIPPGWQQPAAWETGKCLPCFTTPAPDDAAPRSCRGKIDSATTVDGYLEGESSLHGASRNRT